VVLADDSQKSLSDTHALLCCLALFGHFEGMLGCHVVVEALLPRSVRLFKQVGGDRIVVLLSQDFTGRLLINCARQRGLAEVYQGMIMTLLHHQQLLVIIINNHDRYNGQSIIGLLDYDGTELYLQSFPSLIGLRFAEIIQAFDDRCIVVGIHTPQVSSSLSSAPASSPSMSPTSSSLRQFSLNPSDDRVYGNGDQLIILAESARTIVPLTAGNRKRVYDDSSK
jgi:hypothetical protein